MFGLLAYQGTAVGAATYTDLTAAVDDDFSQRNSHYIFSENYDLLASWYGGDDITNGRLLSPTWGNFGDFQLWPPNISATNDIPSPPQVQWLDDVRPALPVNEELQAQITSTAAMASGNVFLWLATKDHNRNLPRGQLSIPIRATAAVANVANAWSAPGAIALASSIRGGVYALVGAAVFCADMLAFRFVFPRQRLYHGRRLRPGWLGNNALGDLDDAGIHDDRFRLGVFGYFHTFELPMIQTFGNAAGAATQEIRLWVQYLGEQTSLLDQVIA